MKHSAHYLPHVKGSEHGGQWAVTVMITKLPNDNGGVIFLYGPPYPRIQLSARHPAGL